MQRFELIDVVGTVKESLSATLFRVGLSNGHDIMGHLDETLASKVSSGEIPCLPGCRVLIQLRAFDLSSGRILNVQPVEV
jgi:translation initiation factor IF-1